MLNKSWGSALSALLITVLVAAGVVATVTPAQAATTVSYSNTQIVQSGSVSTEDFVVSLSGLNAIVSVTLVATGFTFNDPSPGWGGSYFTGYEPVFADCFGSGNRMLVSTGQSRAGECIMTDTIAKWNITGSTLTTVGGTLRIKIPAGKISFNPAGPYSIKVQVDTVDQVTTTLTSPISPQSALSVTSTTGTFGTPLTLTTSGGSGTGALTYAVANGTASGCAVTGGNLSSTSVGTCLVTATKAADSTYSPVSSAQTTVTLGKASRTLSFGTTTTYTLAYNSTQTVTATPSAGPGEGVVTYSVSAGTACTVNSSTGLIRAVESTGSCSVSATITAGTNYLAASTTTQVIVNGTVKAITITGGSPTVNYGGAAFGPTALDISQVLVISQRLNTSAAVYTYTGFNGTSYGPTTTRPTDSGWYHVLPSNVTIETTATTPVDTTANYNISYAAGSLEIRRVSRTISFGTTAYTLAYGDTQTMVATASVGDGAISYSAGSSTACSVNATTGVVTVTAATGTCEISSTVAQGTNYLTATTTTPVTVTTTTRNITLTASTEMVGYGTAAATTSTVTSGTLASGDTISGTTYTYLGTGSTSYNSTTAPTNAGTYTVTPSVAVFSSGSASNYAISYAAGSLSISQASRTLSFATTSISLAYGDTSTVVATPTVAPGDGTLTYGVSLGDACTVGATTGVVTATKSTGTCHISASITAGANYVAAATTTPVAVAIGLRPITVTASNPTINFGSAVAPTYSVTSGTLTSPDAITGVTFTYEGTGSTTYDASTTAPTRAGTYSVTPSAAQFSPGTAADYTLGYTAGTLTINKVSRTISFTTTTYTVAYGNTQAVVASASTGDGAISYSAGSSTACSVGSTSGIVTVTAATGTCSITSTIAEGTNHLTATTTTPVTVTPSTRSITLAASSPTITFGGTSSPAYTLTTGTLAGSDALSGVTYNYAGSGSTTYANSSTVPTAIGMYSITPSAAVFSTGTAANYAVTYTAGTFTISAKTARTVSFATTSLTLEFGDTATRTATVSAGASDGTLSYSVGSSTACTVGASTGLITVTASSGTCAITATITETASFLGGTSSTPLTVTVTPRAITLTASDLTVAYGSAVTPSYTFTSGTLHGSDAISAVSYSYAGTGSTTYASSSTAPTVGGTYSITPSAAVFSSGSAADYTITYVPGTLALNQDRNPVVSITLNASAGTRVLGSTMTFSASGLKPTAGYDIVIRSTPQTLASGSLTGGSASGSATIPTNLEAGWHTITFTSVAPDGSEFTHATYLKVSATGMLLSTSEIMPAELALTGSALALPMMWFAQLLILAGAGLWVMRRRLSA